MPDPAIITGASAGLGVHFAERLAARGHPLVLVARRQDRLDELAKRLNHEHGVECRVFAADLMDPESPPRLLQALDDWGWDPEILINNAGFGATGTFHEIELAKNLGQIRLNIEALTHLCALIVPRMVAKGRGKVLNVASTAAFQPGPGMAVYCATKAYVLSFSEAIAHELRDTGVQVTAHCPGATATEFSQIARNDVTPLFAANVATAVEVVDDALAAMDAGKVVKIHGAKNTVMANINRLVPRAVVRNVAGKILETPKP